MILFFALLFVATAIAGATALVIFWPLMLVHLRDRHPEVRERFGDDMVLNPAVFGWVLSGRYREIRDPNFTGLATPARVAMLTIIIALVCAAAMWLASSVFGS